MKTLVYVLFEEKSALLQGNRTCYPKLTKLFKKITKNENIIISFDAKSRPKVIEPNLGTILHFSVSHKKNSFLLAFSFECKVGVDLEVFDSRKNTLQIANRFFNEKELTAMKQASSPNEKFYDLWTKKEAIYKIVNENFLETLKKTPSAYEKITLIELSLNRPFYAHLASLNHSCKKRLLIKYI